MEKLTYMVKLIPPRPDFAQTMTDEEMKIMNEHASYWQYHTKSGIVQVFGPVFDPRGVYGLGIVSVSNEEELKQFIDNDPSLKFNIVECFQMMATIA